MLYIHKIHQIKLIIVANYERGIIKLKLERMKPSTSFFSTKEKERGNFFFPAKQLLKWEKEVGTVKILR